MTKKIFSFIILLSFFYFSFSQDLVDYNSRQRLEKADKYLFNEQYSDASKIYSSLLMNDYQNKYLLFQLALCYGGMKNQRSNEFNYFSKALGYEISNKPFTYIYKGYPSIIDVNVDSLLPNKKGNKASFKFDVRKAYDNFCVSEDNRFIVFVDITSSKNRVLITRKTSTGWSSPDDITTQIGSMGDCFPSFISNDGRRIYFTRYDGFDSDIYVSIFDGKSWTLIKKLNPNINTSNIEAHACETPDGLILYFASNRPDGFGNMDIYYSIKINGDWNKPVNLGARVNTDMDEDYPHITAGGNLLIFASNGIKKGAGKYEMFYSHFVTDFVWTEPTEMGYPYNTGDDDFFYTPINETSRSFLYRVCLAKNPKKIMNNKTLYVKTFITPSQSDIKVPKMVTVISKTDSVEVRNYEAAALDKFVLFPLKEGNYTIDMKGNGLESKKIDLVVPIIPSTDTLIIKVSLNPGESISDTTNIWKTEQQ